MLLRSASYKNRAQFYQGLGTLYEAGVPVIRALGNPFPAPFGAAARGMAGALEREGGSLAETFAANPRLFSPYECALIRVGERTGRLHVVFPALRDWCEFRVKMRGILLSGLLYPAVLYHAAATLLPSIRMLISQRGFAETGLRVVFWNLLPYMMMFVFRLLSGLLSRSGTFDAAILRLPVIGNLVMKSELAQFFRAYQMAVEAGVHAPEAVLLASGGCRNASVRTAMQAAGQEAERERCPPAEIIARHLPGGVNRHSMAIQLLQTGEATGRSDEMAGRIANLYSEQTVRAFETIASMAPKLVYIFIVLAIAWQVIRSYQAIFSNLYGDL